jgi:hypothetical protein
LKVHIANDDLLKFGDTPQLILANEMTVIDKAADALYVVNPALSDYNRSTVLSKIKAVNKTPWDLSSQGVLLIQMD